MSKISVVIPVYNVAAYLRECLDSVVNQSLTDIEIICVNDGSTDNSLEILQQYAEKDSRFIIVNKENGGLNSARNAGLYQVSSPYFIIVDSDDWIDLSLCQKALQKAEETGADMTHYFFKCVDFPDRTEPPVSAINYNQTSNLLEKLKLTEYNWGTCWSILWKTEFVRNNKLVFDESLKSATEIPFTFLAATLSNYCAVIHEALYYYRYRAESMINNKNSRRFLDRPKAFWILRNQLVEHNISEDCLLFLLYVKCESLYSTYKDIIQSRFATQFRNALRHNIWTDELKHIIKGDVPLSPEIQLFYINIYAGFATRVYYRLRYSKQCFFDWLAHKLVPHSPWLQKLVNQYNHNDTQQP